MALVQKSNPINEDYAIAVIQTHLYSNLLALGVTNYESYERVYVINGSPEIYIGANNYKEVFYDNRFYLTSFFVLGNNKRKVDDDVFEVDLSIVFQADLNKLYPNITHRADAELHRDINNALEGIPSDFEIVEIVTGIDNVYSGFTFKNEQFLDDVSQSHIVRFNLIMQYIQLC
jgi:hypothetical protein